MQSIDGVEIFPLISFVLFFSFFLGVTWWVIKMKKSESDRMAQLPLEGDQ